MYSVALIVICLGITSYIYYFVLYTLACFLSKSSTMEVIVVHSLKSYWFLFVKLFLFEAILV